MWIPLPILLARFFCTFLPLFVTVLLSRQLYSNWEVPSICFLHFFLHLYFPMHFCHAIHVFM